MRRNKRLCVRSSSSSSVPGGVSYQWEPRRIAQRCGSYNGTIAKTWAKHSFLNPTTPWAYHIIKFWPSHIQAALYVSVKACQKGVASHHHLHQCKAKGQVRYEICGVRGQKGNGCLRHRFAFSSHEDADVELRTWTQFLHQQAKALSTQG